MRKKLALAKETVRTIGTDLSEVVGGEGYPTGTDTCISSPSCAGTCWDSDIVKVRLGGGKESK